MRINHSRLFADRENHINAIENFWNQAKRCLHRYNGIPRQNFHLFIKECECRYNYGPSDQLLKTLRVSSPAILGHFSLEFLGGKAHPLFGRPG